MTLTKDELKLVDEVAKECGVTREVAEKALILTKQILEVFQDTWEKVKQKVNDIIQSLSDLTGLTKRQVVILISNSFKDTQ